MPTNPRTRRGKKSPVSRRPPARRSATVKPDALLVPGPAHRRYLDAVRALLDSDEPFTDRMLARRLGMSPDDLVRFRADHPDVSQWASDQLEAESRAMLGPVLQKCAELAAAGSLGHADLLARFVAASAYGLPLDHVSIQGPVTVVLTPQPAGKPGARAVRRARRARAAAW